jgi:alpha-1,2-mannosyltransferase
LGIVAVATQHFLVPDAGGAQLGLLTHGDLDVYRHGGLQVLRGRPLYASEISSFGWFTYPPFAAIVFIPLAAMSFGVAKVIWFMVSFAALLAVVWRCATVLSYRPNLRLGLVSLALALVAVDVEAVWGTLWQGQVNLVLMALIVWDLTRPEGARTRGWSVGLAAGIKLTAVLFVLYLLATRQWRAALTATVTATASVGAAWLVLPADSAQYWFHAAYQIGHIGELTHPGNFSIGGILAISRAPAPFPTMWWVIGAGAATVLGCWAAVRAHLVGDHLAAVTIIGLLACVVPPLAWRNHWVWVLPLLMILLDQTLRAVGSARWSWAAATAATYALVFMWFSTWLYQESLRLGDNYSSYGAAVHAASAHLTRLNKLLFVVSYPLLFVVVAFATGALERRHADATIADKR